MELWDRFRAEYQKRRDQLHPNPLDLSYNLATSRPKWNSFERRDIRQKIRSRNPLRFARLERDMIWLRRELMRLGLDPDQARWLV
jgi:hypothetical protein